MPAKPRTIDEYLANAKPEQRMVLKKLRRAIYSAAPDAEEYIGYGLAGFKLHGRPLVYFGAWANHCALYAASPRTQKKFEKELQGFEVSKGTIRFTPDKPLPVALVKKLIKARIAENVRLYSLPWPASWSHETHCQSRDAHPPAGRGGV